MARQERARGAGADWTPSEDFGSDWRAVGRVVYAWSDRRDPGLDRAWWRMQRARVYGPAARAPGQDTQVRELQAD